LLDSRRDRDDGDRVVLHIDFDYFYAQCEEVRNPSLRTAPLVVCVFSGRTKDSGVVSTANYVARKHGVKSGIPIKVAKSRLANVTDSVFLPVDMRYYNEVSERAMSIIESFAEKFEKVGVDECYLEAPHNAQTFLDARFTAEQIKSVIRKDLGLTCSIGIAPNKLLAKMASDYQKPDGLTLIEPGAAQGFIANLEVDKILGVGPKTRDRLADMGVRTISDLAKIDQFALAEEFGKKTGAFLFNSARGLDNEPVVDGKEKKQIARIITLKADSSSSSEMSAELSGLCRSVLDIAKSRNLSFWTIGVLVILDDLEQLSKSKSLKLPTDNYDVLHSSASALLEEVMAGNQSRKVRRLGVRLSELQDTAGQNTLSQFMSD
jgi:DNA polymerase IV (DinB-like DNA polymerase)